MKSYPFLLFSFLLIFSSCGTSDSVLDEQEPPLQSHTLQNPTTQATLWVQNAAEYKALATQAYATALRKLPLPLEDSFWTASLEQEESEVSALPPAIILDVDETVLDNSPFQARMIKQGKSYNTEDWNQWAGEANAEAVPGAVEFTNYAADKGITIFYITNREHSVEDPTRRNLIKLGFPVSDTLDNILTKGEQENWTSAKTARRALIEDNYRVIMLFGDDLNDFFPAKKLSEAERNSKVKEYSEYFGQKWFVLPNPVYGSWDSAMYGPDADLTEEERKETLLEHLDTRNNN